MPESSCHPGLVLYEDFMIPMGMSVFDLSVNAGIPYEWLTLFLDEQERIDAATADKLSACLVTTKPEYWLNLQKEYDASMEHICLFGPQRS
ncbi:MAG: HigA family addiction module antitoxin [Mariprofundaceae bacterium]